jgi:spore maturation protein CgeB
MPPLKVLLCHPGASWAVGDVYRGLLPALERAGHTVVQYALDGRIQFAEGWLKWVWNHGGRKTEKPSLADTIYQASVGIIERALRFQPDWIISVANMYLHPEALIMLKRAGMHTAILYTESPYDDEQQLLTAPLVDACWVNERSSVTPFRAVQPNTWYYQHAIDPEQHKAEADEALPEVPAHDVVFVGTGWHERIELLSAVDWEGIDLGLYGSWELLGPRHHLRQYLRGGITPNRVAAELYRRAKIGINLHRLSRGWGRDVPRIEHAESINPRCYELAACGSFYVTDFRAELSEIFGSLVPTFTTPAELTALLRRYLADETARRDVAAQLPARVAQQTFDARVAQMIDNLEEVTWQLK